MFKYLLKYSWALISSRSNWYLTQVRIGYGWTLDFAKIAIKELHNSTKKTHPVLKCMLLCMIFIMDQEMFMDITHMIKFVLLNLFVIPNFHSCLLFHRRIWIISKAVEFSEWVPMMTKITEEIYLLTKWRIPKLLIKLFFHYI